MLVLDIDDPRSLLDKDDPDLRRSMRTVVKICFTRRRTNFFIFFGTGQTKLYVNLSEVLYTTRTKFCIYRTQLDSTNFFYASPSKKLIFSKPVSTVKCK